MACDNKLRVLTAGTKAKNGKVYNEDVLVPCGQCYPCRIRRLSGWIFRIKQEELKSSSAYFVTFTYSPKTVPISKNGFMTLKPKDMQDFYKRLRNTYRYRARNPETGKMKWYYDKVPKIKHYTVGEYGGKGEATGYGRPHYHAIILNSHPENIIDSWSKYNTEIGNVKIGDCNNKTIAYTLTYMIVKSGIEKKHGRDDRKKEFSIMSNGIGRDYIDDNVKYHYKNNLEKMYILDEGNKKLAMPKYYRNIIYDDKEKSTQTQIIQAELKRKELSDRRTDEQKRNVKIQNLQKFKKSKK